jgi:hypothetical protein
MNARQLFNLIRGLALIGVVLLMFGVSGSLLIESLTRHF